MNWNRRRVLAGSGALVGVAAAGLLAGSARSQETAVSKLTASGQEAADGQKTVEVPGARHSEDAVAKRIALVNLHTSERVDVEFFRGEGYVSDALAAIEVLLRDFRTGERHAIDPKLLDYLVEVARSVGVDPVFSVISGYRSPQTNARLRAQSSEVSQRSLHMEGRAIDVRVTGVDCAELAARAQDLRRGGVGYYRASDFVHLDTGAFRTWRG